MLANGLTSGVDALAEGVAIVAEGRADRALVCAAEVATPLLSAILGGAPLVDAAAALVVERTATPARVARRRGRACSAPPAPSPPAHAPPRCATRPHARSPPPTCAEPAIRRLLDAGAGDAAGALGAAPLVALARWLGAGERDHWRCCRAGDDGGAGSAAVVVAS